MSLPQAPAPTVRDADEILVGFTRALRAAGVPVTQDRTHGYLTAVSLVGLHDHRATYDAGRATLCASPEDLVRYDDVHAAYFNAAEGLPRERRGSAMTPSFTDLPLADDAGDEGDGPTDDEAVRARASDADLLRERDVAGLSVAERQRLNALLGGLRPRWPVRRVARHDPWRRGRIDASRTLRASLRRMGEPAEVEWRRRSRRPRRALLLLDVSGSMSGYAEVLLRLAHRMSQAMAAQGGRVETFTVGTRLTRVTRSLDLHDVERAIVAAGREIPDWSGGTRLGETMERFMSRSGQRGAARGAVVVVFSDGWERGDTAVLAEQMRRLHGMAHRVVWVNPHRGKIGYEPVQQGMIAVLPFVDDFVAGHSLATYSELIEVIARA
ncbi:MAG: hypothetical protein JWR90_3878 [Marmoricola sp.]|nr:hypothetical protein [Marmoricola sp.]